MFSKPFMVLMAAALLAPALAGCETVESWASGDSVEIRRGNVEESVNIEPVSLTPPSAVPSDRDLKQMTTKLSNGSVEVYDLDEPDMISLSSPSAVDSIQMPQGVTNLNNPSVTVYPLDDSGISMPAYDGGITPAPAYGAEPVMPPMNNTPPDAHIWGDGADTSGKLNSTAGKDISRIYFPYGSDRLDQSDRSVLSSTAETAKFAPVDRVRVEGHASTRAQVSDPVKAKVLNLKESMNRAYAVSRDLIQQGVPAEKIKTVAYGDTIPAGSEPAQRRVDVVTGAGY